MDRWWSENKGPRYRRPTSAPADIIADIELAPPLRFDGRGDFDDEPAATKCPDCGGHCGGTFTCAGCGRERGWCIGCGDNMPDYCDDCWVTDEPTAAPGCPSCHGFPDYGFAPGEVCPECRDSTSAPADAKPACWGCECEVPLVDGSHREATDIPGTVYAYPCTAPRTHSPGAWALAAVAARLGVLQ